MSGSQGAEWFIRLPRDCLRTARARSARDWAMILLACRHGLRASEVCDLKMTDVDLKARPLSIRRLKGSLHTVQPLYRHKGQPLLDEIAALRSWLRERQPDGSDCVFVSQKGGPTPSLAVLPRRPGVCRGGWLGGRRNGIRTR
jgi:integrase